MYEIQKTEPPRRSHHSRRATFECGTFVWLMGQTEPLTVRRAMAEGRYEVKLGIHLPRRKMLVDEHGRRAARERADRA
jgi:hypothetical protein